MSKKWAVPSTKKPEEHFYGRNLKFSMTCSSRRSHSGQKQNTTDKEPRAIFLKSMWAHIGEAEQQVESRRENRDGSKIFWYWKFFIGLVFHSQENIKITVEVIQREMRRRLAPRKLSNTWWMLRGCWVTVESMNEWMRKEKGVNFINAILLYGNIDSS